ncbi:MAG: hypothetical protein WA071_03090 [Undibacterium umbellatum]|uniref:hypothetical protein n=1 Tax=Undibacterium umbellatum TaxID=2762300 RepID=UPI003BB612B0
MNKSKFAAMVAGAGIVLAGCGGYVYTTVGGKVTGLGSGDTLTLRNEGNYLQTLYADGTFQFNVASNGNYTISVAQQPNSVNCTVANGSGKMSGEAAVNNIAVTCTPNVPLGGTVAGMTDGASMILLNNNLYRANVTANGSFKFADFVVSGTTYAITVGLPPVSQYCTVANGTGTASNANLPAALTSVVTCVPAVPVKFTVNGLTAGTVLTLVNTVDGYADKFAVSAPGNYLFGWSWLSGKPFNVTVDTQPTGQTCKVTGGTGVVDAANPAASANIVVDCAKT